MDVVAVYTIALAVVSGVLAVVAIVHVARQWPRPPGLDKLTWGLEAGLAVRAMIGVGQITSGDKPDHLATYIGYLVTSIAILPIILATIADDRDHWTNGVLAAGLVAVTVVIVRLQMTASGHA